MYARRSFVLLTYMHQRCIIGDFRSYLYMQDITQVKMIRSSDHVKQ